MSAFVLDNYSYVSEVLSVTPSLSEILWNFSRHEGRARITLEQNPHFYSSLPADESAYTPTFKHHPLRDLSTLKPHDTVYVLVDRPGRVFLESEREQRRFGNVWNLNGTQIFQGVHHFSSRQFLSDIFPDSSGVLEGEKLVRNTIIGNWRRYDEPSVFLNFEFLARLCRSHLPPIITTPSVNPTLGRPFDDWTVLSHPSSYSRNMHIYPAQSPHRSMNMVCFDA